MFSPYLFQALDLQGLTVDRLQFTFDEIIKRHSVHVQKIRWRVADHDSVQQERKEWSDTGKSSQDASWNSQWDLKSRSELLLGILQTCPWINDLDIDLDTGPSIPTENSETSDSRNVQDSSRSTGNPMRDLFIKPITQLTSLTHLSLSSASRGPPYTESFLGKILAHLPQLKIFSCTGIKATHPRPLDDRPAKCKSPLGIHLASLTSLVELNLHRAECVDSSWSQLDWKSSLKVLSLVYCNRVSVRTLHRFIKPFSSSLTTLICNNLCNIAYGELNPVAGPIWDDVKNDKYRFKLPKLVNLEISHYLPIQFARSFRHSTNLTWLSLGDPLQDEDDFEALITDKLWPKLKKFEFPDYKKTLLLPENFKHIQEVCQQHGIEMRFGGKVYGEDEDEDVFDEAMFEDFVNEDQEELDEIAYGGYEDYDYELEEQDPY